MPSRVPSISDRRNRLGNRGSSNSRQPSKITLNASKRTDGGGIARISQSSTTNEQNLVPPVSSNNDIVDEGNKRRSFVPQPSSVRRDFVAEHTQHGDKDQPVKASLGWTRPEDELPKGSQRVEEPASRVRPPQMPLSTRGPKTDGSIANKTIASKTTVPITAMKRSQSLRKPTNYDGIRKPELRSHSRNASAIVKPNDHQGPIAHRRQMSHTPGSAYSLPRPNSGSTYNSRPTSAASTSGSVSNISTRSKTKPPSNRVAGVCLTAPKEALSTANKHASLKDQIVPDQEQSQSQRSSLETTTSKSISNNRSRPAFTTLQQHYTPKKTAKASTLSIIAASATKSAHVNVPSPDMIRLQTELLELHLLHRTSAEIQRQWEHSAESTLQNRYEDVAERYRELRFKQSKAQERTDLQALREWGPSHGSRSFSEKVGLLSRTLQDLSNIESAGGKYAHVVTTFERWVVLSESVKQLGQRTSVDDAQDLEFLESLGEGWRSEVAALEMRLASRALDLKRLGQPREGSSLAYLVEICTTLVAQMSEELKTMREIECEVLEREATWMRKVIDCIDPKEECEPKNTKSTIRRGVWQTG